MLDGNKIKHQFVQTEMEGFLRDLKTDYSAGYEAMYADAPLMKVYRGGTRFAKHYLGPNCVPAFDGEKKDGEGEEFDCAVQIDAHPAVRFWLRNLAKHHRSFSLPLSHDSFYPDFVGELTDGRLFAVEYKCEHLRNAKDTLEKDAIGRLWAAKSSGKCLYATVYKSDGGLDVKGQLDLVVRAANRGRSVR